MADDIKEKMGHLSPKVVIPIFILVILGLGVIALYAYSPEKFAAMADETSKMVNNKGDGIIPQIATKFGAEPKEIYTFGSPPIIEEATELNDKVFLPQISKAVVIIYPTQTEKSRGNPGAPPVYVGKCIELDLSSQRMFVWENGQLLQDWATSTGRPDKPTKKGNFKVLDKMRWAYGSGGGDTWAMPYWLGFYFSGGTENGIHGLPLINGRKEGHGSLGTPVSHGCVRVADSNIVWLYNWAEIGTPVIVHK